MFKIFKRLNKLEKDFKSLSQEVEGLLIITHNLIEDFRNSGASHVDQIVFCNVLYKALEGHYQAIQKLINVDSREDLPFIKFEKESDLYPKKTKIFPISKKKKNEYNN